jgi:hypothetical protein
MDRTVSAAEFDEATVAEVIHGYAVVGDLDWDTALALTCERCDRIVARFNTPTLAQVLGTAAAHHRAEHTEAVPT